MCCGILFRDEFVLQKLKKEAAEEGAYVLRWSVMEYQCIILVVLSRTEVIFIYCFMPNRRNLLILSYVS